MYVCVVSTLLFVVDPSPGTWLSWSPLRRPRSAPTHELRCRATSVTVVSTGPPGHTSYLSPDYISSCPLLLETGGRSTHHDGVKKSKRLAVTGVDPLPRREFRPDRRRVESLSHETSVWSGPNLGSIRRMVDTLEPVP